MDPFHPSLNGTAQPTSAEEVLALYQQHLAPHVSQRRALLQSRTVILLFLAALLVLFFLLARFTGTSAWSALPYLLLFISLIFLITRYLRVQARIATEDRLLVLYTTAIARVDGTEPQSGKTGPTVLATHLYARDLDLLGADSLFGLLATTRTAPGERGLARYLLEPATHAETLLRQEAVQELAPHTGLREQIALLGASEIQSISPQLVDEWIETPAPTFHPALRPALAITAALAILLLRTALAGARPWAFILPNLAAVLAIQAALCFVVRAQVAPLLATSIRLERSVRLFAEGLALLDSLTFSSPKLRLLQEQARPPAGAVRELNRLRNQIALAEQRGQAYFLLPSLLLAAGTQTAISLARWKRKHAAGMRTWLDSWSEFEALNALATYAFEHPPGDGRHSWPRLLPPEAAPTFHANALAHPLLPRSVTNDVALDPSGAPFYLISGSNMAGKSTLLRSVGVNAVLAYAGAPVTAKSLELTPLILGASLALTDSLANRTSKFLAEVERLSAIVSASKTRPVLFLVDEIFSGTNSLDRRTAAEAVLQTLLAHGAIGALSTHDLALTELADSANRGLNVHMASPDPEDPLAFDYKLKPGINTASNALAIVRLMGLGPSSG